MILTNYVLFQQDLATRGIEYAAEHTLALGMNAVEFLAGIPGNIPTFKDLKEAEKTAEVLKRYGLKTSCFSSGASLYGPDMAMIEEGFKRYSEIAAIVGAPYLHHTLFCPLVMPQDAPSYETVFNSVIDAVERIAAHAKQFGVTCLYEPQGMYFNGVAGVRPLITEMKKRATNVGVCGDVGNCLYVDDDPVAVFEAFAPDILHVHMKDYFVRTEKGDNPSTKPSRGGRWLTLTEIGAGDIDLVGAMRVLTSVNYDSAIALEVKGDDDFMRRSIEYIKSVYCSVYGV